MFMDQFEELSLTIEVEGIEIDVQPGKLTSEEGTIANIFEELNL